ncbi:hypothetical protein AAG747_19195 [Rapidithrix thailandica]|uniref:YD repeat-containing protein n=1 Tax=Rapidithrix thailandica TaxID=413964 RepID=A0AAW9S9A3_9BACT
MDRILIAISFIPFMITSCQNESSVIIDPDPFKKAFQNQGIRMITSYEPYTTDIVDTTYLNKQGQITLEKEYASTKRYEYDSSGNLVRLLSVNDVPSNYFIEYQKEDNKVLQKWYLINHLRWDFEEKDLDVLERTVEFKLDASGKVTEGKDLDYGVLTRYEYDNTKLISRKVYSDEDFDNPRLNWIYKYSGDSKLIKIECFKESELFIEHYYNDDGLLDSTRRNNYSIVYKYKYY